MLSRADAIEAIAGQRFEVVVIGGGITGAGVALDAASRGYSVALLERDDYAVGTSSRSSKMVHGGLRYLQNFDLGLVREALLERQLMVQLAPHLVYPTPFLVPTLGEDRRDRRIGIGLNMYDVMATTRVGRSRREMRSSKRRGRGLLLVARPPPHDRRRRGRRADPGAGAARPEVAPTSSTTARPTTSRLVLTVLGEAERFGAVMLNGAEVTEVLERDGTRRRRRLHRGRVRRADRGRGRQRRQRDRRLGRPDPARGGRGGGRAADRAQPRHPHHRSTQERAADGRRPPASSRPARSRTIFALPWYGRTLVGTTDNDYDGDIAHPQPAADDVEYLLDAVNDFFGTSLGASDLTGAYAGVRPLISTGDPQQVGRHLAQGGAL